MFLLFARNLLFAQLHGSRLDVWQKQTENPKAARCLKPNGSKTSNERRRRRHGSRWLSSSSLALSRRRVRDGVACYCRTRRRDRRCRRRSACSRTVDVTVVCRASLCCEAYAPEQVTLVLCARAWMPTPLSKKDVATCKLGGLRP